MGGILQAIAMGPRMAEVPSVQDLQARNMQLQAMAQQGYLRQQEAALTGMKMQEAQLDFAERNALMNGMARAVADPANKAADGTQDWDKTYSSLQADPEVLGRVRPQTLSGIQTTILGNRDKAADIKQKLATAEKDASETTAKNQAIAKEYGNLIGNWAQDRIDQNDVDPNKLIAYLTLHRADIPSQQAQAHIDGMIQTVHNDPTQTLPLLQEMARGLSPDAIEARAKTVGEQAKTAQTQLGYAVEQMRGLPVDPATGQIVPEGWKALKASFQRTNPQLAQEMPDEPDPNFIQRKFEATIPGKDWAEYQQKISGLNLPLDQQAYRAELQNVAAALHIQLKPGIPIEQQIPSDARELALKRAKALMEPAGVAEMREQNLLNAQMRGDQLRREQDFARGGVASMMASPDIYYDGGFTGPEKATLGSAWTAQTGLPIPKKLTPDMQNQEGASQLALTRLGRIRQLMADPELQPVLGSVMGKIDDVQAKTGTAVGLSDSQARKAQELRSNLNYFLLGEGRAIIGGRMVSSILDQLKQTSPRMDEAIPRLQGAIDSADQNARDVLTRNEQYRFGGKMRPNFQPGFTTPGGTTSPPATQGARKPAPPLGTVKNGYMFMGGDPASSKSWKPVKQVQ